MTRIAWSRATVLVATLVAGGCASTKDTSSATSGAGPSVDLGAEPAARSEAFRGEFRVDPANWADRGRGEYFILEPGWRWRYAHGPAVLTITVLDETQVVDGVTTRVVEEREEKGGQVQEVSRNYFAIDKTTGDVYYFGEAVDEYKNGKLASHGGAWRAGENGAKFGLMMPGHPVAGDKFYQEDAPRVARDRAEIVSVDARLTTPAGTFEKCVQIRETTPLEAGVSHKCYAPGVGLIKDDALELVSFDVPHP